MTNRDLHHARLIGESIAVADPSASDPKTRPFTGLAYTGGVVFPSFGPAPLVIELATLQLPESRLPLLAEHTLPIGFITGLRLTDRGVEVDGELMLSKPLAATIAMDADAGFPWQQSLGFDFPSGAEFVPEGSEIDLNGAALSGPLFVGRGGIVREASIVVLGADHRTNVAMLSRVLRREDPPMPSASQTKPSARPAAKLGRNLADRLESLIADQTSDDMPREAVIESLAADAGIEPATVNEILNADIDCPPRERLEGFAESLGVDVEELIAAAQEDGCDMQTTTDNETNRRDDDTAQSRRSGCADCGAAANRSPAPKDAATTASLSRERIAEIRAKAGADTELALEAIENDWSNEQILEARLSRLEQRHAAAAGDAAAADPPAAATAARGSSGGSSRGDLAACTGDDPDGDWERSATLRQAYTRCALTKQTFDEETARRAFMSHARTCRHFGRSYLEGLTD